MKCPHCGHVFIPSRKVKVPEPPGPDATTATLYAYYKATAPAEDIAFVLRGRLDLQEWFTAQDPSPTAREVFEHARASRRETQVPDESRFWTHIGKLRQRAIAAGFNPPGAASPSYGTWPPLVSDIEQREKLPPPPDD